MMCDLCTPRDAVFRVHGMPPLVTCAPCLPAGVRSAIDRFLEHGVPGAVEPGELDVVGVSVL